MAGPWRAGHLVTAKRLNAALGTITGRILAQAGTYLTTSGTTELDLPKLAVADYPVVAGRYYKFELRVQGNASVANDQFAFRVRRDTAVSGTELAQARYQVANVTAFTDQRVLIKYWKATTTNPALDLFVSVQRTAGSGTLAIHGDTETQFAITDVGDIATFVEVP